MNEEMMKDPGNANVITRKYMDEILIEERLIDAAPADLSIEFFGEKFDTPIMMPAFSHMDKSMKDGRNAMVEYSKAAKELNMVNFVGMRENEEMDSMIETGAKLVRIIKPYKDRAKIFSQIAYAKEKGLLAVGIDTDHAFGYDGRDDLVVGELMQSITSEELKSYVEAAKPLPFLIKGVLSVSDALKCKEAGVQGFLVSHHSGRLPYAVPPLKVLPAIRKAVGSEMKIIVDCGIARGADVFKCLALGADAAAVGRAFMPALIAEGCEGTVKYVTRMNDELRMCMSFTGSKTVKDIEPSMVYVP